MIRINIKNKGNITVFENEKSILKMIRSTPVPFLTTIGEIFQNDIKLATIQFHFLLGKKIAFQHLPFTVEIIKQRWFNSTFAVGENIIRIKHNPFFLFNKRFCKVYFNSEQVIKISIKNIIDVNG